MAGGGNASNVYPRSNHVCEYLRMSRRRRICNNRLSISRCCEVKTTRRRAAPARKRPGGPAALYPGFQTWRAPVVCPGGGGTESSATLELGGGGQYNHKIISPHIYACTYIFMFIFIGWGRSLSRRKRIHILRSAISTWNVYRMHTPRYINNTCDNTHLSTLL
jgi:hypothetical protein